MKIKKLQWQETETNTYVASCAGLTYTIKFDKERYTLTEQDECGGGCYLGYSSGIFELKRNAQKRFELIAAIEINKFLEHNIL